MKMEKDNKGGVIPTHLETLQKARDTYGNKNQIMVSIEELNELACVLAKYPRYEEHEKAIEELKEKAVDEVADVMIVINHIVNIFEMDWQEEIEPRIDKKIERLRRWLEKSESMEQTTVDREVK
jgi:NTP pyrophosphatase (non-canonical NTP hydrolase)